MCTGLIVHVLFTLTVTAAIPLSVHTAMLAVLMLFNGVAFGSLNNGRTTGTYMSTFTMLKFIECITGF